MTVLYAVFLPRPPRQGVKKRPAAPAAERLRKAHRTSSAAGYSLMARTVSRSSTYPMRPGRFVEDFHDLFFCHGSLPHSVFRIAS